MWRGGNSWRGLEGEEMNRSLVLGCGKSVTCTRKDVKKCIPRVSAEAKRAVQVMTCILCTGHVLHPHWGLQSGDWSPFGSGHSMLVHFVVVKLESMSEGQSPFWLLGKVAVFQASLDRPDP